MPDQTPATLDLARRRAMARFEQGDIPGAEAELTKLIQVMAGADGIRYRELRYSLYQDRATVRRRANSWDAALDDLAAAEGLLERLPLLLQVSGRSSIAQARALILSDSHYPGAEPAAVLSHLELARQSGSREHLAAADDLESRLAFRAGEWEKAAGAARKAAQAFDRMGWPGAAAICRRRTAEALLAAGDLPQAERELTVARNHIDRFGTPLDMALTDLLEAKLLARQNQDEDAWERTLASLDSMDGLIRRFSVLSEQQAFLIDKLAHYGEAFAIAMAAGGERGWLRAWTIAERSKSFYLCQLLTSAEINLFEDGDPAVVGRLRDIGIELDRLEMGYGGLDERLREASVGHALVMRIRELSRQKANALQDLMRANPRWARVAVPSGLDLEAQIESLPERWAFLSYFWEVPTGRGKKSPQAGRLHLFWTDASKRALHTFTDWTHEEMQLLRRARARLTGRVPIGAELLPRRLADLIVPRELTQSIPRDFRVLISPHGPLQLVPVQALMMETGHYAAAAWAIQYIPTLALLPLARAPLAKAPVLLIGCQQDGFASAPLPEVPGELRAIRRAWATQGTRPVTCRLIATDGTPEAEGVGLGRWGEFGIVHVACHGDFPPNRPFDAALRLGTAAIRMSDFFGIRLGGAVASFSACSVGRHAEDLDGRAVIGDEWIGLYLPLLYAGARCVIASLWDAYSEPAGRFMTFLHAGLERGDEPADAVRWAQDRAASEMPEPATWANWYPVGFPTASAMTRDTGG